LAEHAANASAGLTTYAKTATMLTRAVMAAQDKGKLE